MIKHISSTFFVMILAMLASFAVTVILGRNLTTNEFGEFALLKQLVLVGSTIVVYGLDYSYTKIFIKQPYGTKKTHSVTLTLIIILSIAFSSFLYFTYSYSAQKIILISLSVLFGAINLYLAAIHRLIKKYFLAQLIMAGWKILLLFLIIIYWIADWDLTIDIVYQLLFISMLIFSSYMINIISKAEQSSKIKVNLKDYATLGFVFWMINSTGLISGGIDKLFIPIVHNSEILGIYTAVSFVFIISMGMIGSAFGYVLFPKISAGDDINYGKLIILLASISLMSIIVFQIFGVKLVSGLFSSKYDGYIDHTLILSFTIIGILQIIQTVLHFVVSARGDRKHLIQYWFVTVGSIVFFITALYAGDKVSSLLLYISLITISTYIFKIFLMGSILHSIQKSSKKQIIR